MKENTGSSELEGGKRKRRWKFCSGVGGDTPGGGTVARLSYMRREGEMEVARSTAPVPPHNYGSTLIDKAAS